MANQICAFCGRPRRKDADTCANCGASQWIRDRTPGRLTKDEFAIPKRPPIEPTG